MTNHNQYTPTTDQRLYRELLIYNHNNIIQDGSKVKVFPMSFAKAYLDSKFSRYFVYTKNKLVKYADIVSAMAKAYPGSFVEADLCYDLPIIGSHTFRVRTPRPVMYGEFIERVTEALEKYL